MKAEEVFTLEEHGIHRTNVPWSRRGSGFTLLFERVVMALVKEMPVSAVARRVGTTDNRLWRIIRHYVTQATNAPDLSGPCGIGLDETAGKRGHNDMSPAFPAATSEEFPNAAQTVDWFHVVQRSGAGFVLSTGGGRPNGGQAARARARG